MLVCLYLTCVVLIGLYLLTRHHWRQARHHFAGLPTFPQVPLLGNVLQLSGDGRNLFSRIVEMSEKAEETRLPFALWLGPFPILICSEPDDVRIFTNALIEKPYYYSFGRVWLGDGLVLAPGSIWKRSIKKLAGTFNSNVVDGYQEVFNKQAQKLVEQLKLEVGNEPFDVMQKYLAYTTLETICQTALGFARISESIVTTEYYVAFNRALELFIARGVNVLLHPEWVYRFTSAHKELMKCITVIHNVSQTVINDRIKEREEKKKLGPAKEIDSEREKVKFKAFLDILLEMSDNDPTLTDDQIRSEVDTIILGGQETVASTLSYTLLMIGCNPNIQDKLYLEIKQIFDGSTRAVQKEDLFRMEYCEAVIYETLRLFPPVPVVMRYADRDLQLKSCMVPKGTACGINAWGAGRSRRLWGDDAAQYRPERWLVENPGNTAAFLAFSYGRRACIGKKYAIAILKTVLAYCIRELEFVSEAEKMELKVDIALRPISGQLIQVRKRCI